jgi:hypothetical protein
VIIQYEDKYLSQIDEIDFVATLHDVQKFFYLAGKGTLNAKNV